MIRRTALVLIAAAALSAQAPQPPGPSEPKGVSSAWDVGTQLNALASAVGDTEKLVLKVDPRILAENGAPEAYVQQVRSVQSGMKSLLAASAQLAREPEKLPVALDVYFQMERLDLLLNSLREGIRKYQSPDLADMIMQTVGKNVVHRDRLRQHIVDVAELHDQEYQIANEEAQRCRGTLSKQPVSAPDRSKTQTPGNSSSPTSSNPGQAQRQRTPSRK